MMKNILLFCFFCTLISGTALCQQETEIDSQVISVNPDKEYLVIKAGEKQGVEIGDGVVVHRGGSKIADAQIIEVRPEVAAAEILDTRNEIKEGDAILIVKKAKRPSTIRKEKIYPEPRKSKWTTILGSSAEVKSTLPVETVTSGPGGRIETLRPADIARADINTEPGTVFSYALMILREDGYSVISSNRVTGVILASDPIELSIMQELWADAKAEIEHKLVVSLEIKDKGGLSELSVSGFKEHLQKGKQVKFPVGRESKYYSDLVALASKIKERAER